MLNLFGGLKKIHTIPRYSSYIKFREMKYLNVAEKNDAAKTIAAHLSNGTSKRREGFSKFNKIYEFETTVRGIKSKMIMTSVSGHLMQLEFLNAYRNWQNVDPQSLFHAPIRKRCGEDYEPIKRTLEREVRSCQGLIIWTDCDREGENIGFEIVDVCHAVKPNLNIYRATFSEITSAAIRRALNNLSIPDKRQSDAVDVRTELDLRTGASITRFQTMRLQRLFPEKIADKLISYGSCQIPTLGFVAERYKEIEAFVSEPFWKIKVFHTIDDFTVEFNWARNRLFDKQACEDYYLIILSNPKATVESVTVKSKSKWRPTPMDTVELEKLGSRKLKLSAKEVMTIAEKLYTKGFISYPRTETNMFSKDINLMSLVEQQVEHTVWGTFAQRVKEWGPNPRNGNKSDQAHPPIHPTKMIQNLDGNEGRVYELICRHFLACVSKDAVGSETVVNINIEGEKFSASGLVIFETNYLDIYIYDKWNAKQIHHYEEGQVFDPTEITMAEGATTAPSLLTEADLIALMEKHGIGTDATHAEHINTIKERGYIGVVDKGGLVPGIIGMGLYESYNAMELALTKPALRAEFEADLKRICLGEKNPGEVLREHIIKYKEAYKQIMTKVSAMDEKMSERINEPPATTNSLNENNLSSTAENSSQWQELFPCPKCSQAHLALKAKKNQSGFFIGCLNYPDCKNVIWLPDECKEAKVLDENCSKCGSTFKLLKFKFSNPYHKTLFSTPSGWYKTCLRCDVNFRSTFNINLDCIKKTGPIVSDSASATCQAPHANENNINSRGRTNYRKDSSSNGKDQKENKKSVKTKLSKTDHEKRQTDTDSTMSKSKKSIRSYCTSTSAVNNAQTIGEIATAELQNIPLDEFFDSNDDFAIGELDTNRPQQTTEQSTALCHEFEAAFAEDDDIFEAIECENSRFSQQQPRQAAVFNSAGVGAAISSFDDSLSTLFRNDDDQDYTWGSAARNAHTADISSSCQGPSSKRLRVQTIQDDVNVDVTDDLAKTAIVCSECRQPTKELTVKKDGPNKGRIFYVCSKSNSCKFFQWANESQQCESMVTNPTSSSANLTDSNSSIFNHSAADILSKINCHCQKLAGSLTVRKEGPNKGRRFYACSNRDKSCGFFKWADEDDLLSNRIILLFTKIKNSLCIGNSSRDQKSSDTSANHHMKRTSASSSTSKIRKCGLCRQEGHTRQKCPRKNEFDF
uniref:DNA topoisomerase n=1 Tax=Glossina brevipalpis TaxID=37001 RepID=A0A1A9WUA1_9MUSC